MTAISDPAYQFAAVTPSNTTILRGVRALYIGGAGNVAVVGKDGGSAVTFTGVAAGTVLPVQASMVMSTNTTATNIVALY